MSTIGSLTIEMAADIARLRKDMDDARRVVSSTMADMRKAADMAKVALGALGVGLGAGAFVGFVRNAIDAADALDEMSQRVGVSARDLSALQVAYRQSGMGSEAMASSMAKLSKEMVAGNDGLNALGVSARGTDGKLRSSTAVLLDVADKFKAMEDGAGETALAMEIFGKSGAEMVPMLNMGSEGIREMMDQAERLGLVISDDTAKAAGDFNDTVELLGLGLQGIGTRIAADMLPTLNALTGAFLESMTEGDALGNTADVLSVALKSLYSVGVGVVTAFSTLGKTLGAAGAQLVAIMHGDFAGAVEIGKQWSADISSSWQSAATTISKAWDDQGNAAVAGAAKTMRASNDVLGAYKAQQEAAKNAGKVSEYDKLMAKIQEKLDLERQEAAVGKALTEAQKLEVEVTRQLAEAKDKLTEAQRRAVRAKVEELKRAEAENERQKAFAKVQEDRTKESEQDLQRARQALDQQREQNAAIGLGAVEVAKLAAAKLENEARDAEAKAMWAQMSGIGGAAVKNWQDQAAALRELAKAKVEGAEAQERQKRIEEGQKLVDQFLQDSTKTDFSAGFDKASQSLGVFVQTFGQLISAQEKWNKAREEATGNAYKLAEVEAAIQLSQVHAYGDLTGAAKGFFREGSKGYKAMSVAEKAFRAIEMAMAIETALTKIGLIESVTTAKLAGDAAQTDSLLVSAAKQIAAFFGIGTASAAAGVANQAQGDPYSAFPRMAAMAAIMAGLGFATGAFGGGGGSFAATNTGTGTVLGDPAAQSESIANSLEILRDVDTMTMRYSAQMLDALRSIEANISGVTTLLVQSGGVQIGSAGIATGYKPNALTNAPGRLVQAGANFVRDKDGPFGGLVAAGLSLDVSLARRIFGVSQNIVGQGISADPQTMAAISAAGFQGSYYADVQRKNKFLGMTTATSNSTQLTAADPELERQFTLILTGFSDAVQAAAGPLGVSLDLVKSRLASFVVDIGRIDLQGLTGDEINERLTAVFGAAGDNIAKAALTGFEAFQQIGEGYLETIVRVASGVEEATSLLKRLGVSAVALSSIEAKQGAVAAELVRESVQATEGLTGISEILGAIDGSASELADTYTALTDLRMSLRLLGLDGAAVGFDLLSGAGGLQSLSDALDAFEEGFATAAQQTRNDAARLAEQFKDLGLALPKGADEFVALVNGIDTSTAAGRSLLGSVLGLSSGFADLLSAIKETGSGIADEIERIRGLDSSTSAMGYSQLQAQFAIQSAAARAGNQSAIDALPKISQDLLDAASATASSSADLARIRDATLASLEATLAAISDPAALLSGVPGFATGGSFAGGLRIVGENGPELEVTGAARYYSAGQTAQLMAGTGGRDELLAELQALRAEVSALRQENQAGDLAIAGNTGKVARLLERATTADDALRISTDGTADPLATSVV